MLAETAAPQLTWVTYLTYLLLLSVQNQAKNILCLRSGLKNEAVGSLIIGNMMIRNLIKAQGAFRSRNSFFPVTTAEPARVFAPALRAPGQVVAPCQALEDCCLREGLD